MRIFKNKLKDFDRRSKVNGLLLGEVQSGKTGQMFGIIAAAADLEYDFFVIATSNINRLQQQTYERTFLAFTDFQICNINNTVEFRLNQMKKPVVLVLKKDTSVLRKWRNEILETIRNILFKQEIHFAQLNSVSDSSVDISMCNNKCPDH